MSYRRLPEYDEGRPLSDDELEQMRSMLSATTGGHWDLSPYHVGQVLGEKGVVAEVMPVGSCSADEYRVNRGFRDVEFIAVSKRMVSALLAEVNRLKRTSGRP